MMMLSAEFNDVMAALGQDLVRRKEHVPHDTASLQSVWQELQNHTFPILRDEQLFRVCIMGQVNSGKSSFINALLFHSAVDPERSIPKTITLTRIVYAPTPAFTAHFYTEQEWQDIQLLAHSGTNYVEARAARGLLSSARGHKQGVSTILQQGRVHYCYESIEAMSASLKRYTAEDGIYTPLVKMVDIFLPLDILRGLEVFDAPGMNVPLPSRVIKTRECVEQCDLVLFFSGANQFLNRMDRRLLRFQLPLNGMKNIFLVASRLEQAVLAEGKSCFSLREVERKVSVRATKRAEDILERLAYEHQMSGNDTMAGLLRQLKAPTFLSTYAHIFAEWPQKDWDSTMLEVFNQLTYMAQTYWDGSALLNTDWERMSNFALLREKYFQLRTEKQCLWPQQQKLAEATIATTLAQELTRLLTAIQFRLQEHDDSHVHVDLTAASDALIDALQQVLSAVHQQLLATYEQIQLQRVVVTSQIDDLPLRTMAEKQVTTETVSTSDWFNPLSWGSQKVVEEESFSTRHYLVLSDMHEQLLNEYRDTVVAWEKQIQPHIDSQLLQQSLYQALQQNLQNGTYAALLHPYRMVLEQTLAQLPSLHWNIDLDGLTPGLEIDFYGYICSDKDQEQAIQSMVSVRQQVAERLTENFDAAWQTLMVEFEQLKSSITENIQTVLTQEQQRFIEMAQSETEDTQLLRGMLRAIAQYLAALLPYTQKG